MDVLLAGVPDAGVEPAEQEAVVSGLPAVVHLALVRLVHAVVDAVVAPQLAAVGLGDALGALAPVRGDEGGGGEEQSHQVQGHRQQRAAFPRRLHDLGAVERVPEGVRKSSSKRRRDRWVRGGGRRGEAWRGQGAQRNYARLLRLCSPLLSPPRGVVHGAEGRDGSPGISERRNKDPYLVDMFFHPRQTEMRHLPRSRRRAALLLLQRAGLSERGEESSTSPSLRHHRLWTERIHPPSTLH